MLDRRVQELSDRSTTTDDQEMQAEFERLSGGARAPLKWAFIPRFEPALTFQLAWSRSHCPNCTLVLQVRQMTAFAEISDAEM